MSTASSDDTHEVTPSLHEIKPWPCPHCRYDLRSAVDSWKEEPVTCPECGESCTASETVFAMYSAAPSGWIWQALSWLPTCFYCYIAVLLFYTTPTTASSKVAVIVFVVLVPIVWLFGLSMYRYRYFRSLTNRVFESLFMMIFLLMANIIATIVLIICAAIAVELFDYIF